MRRATTSVPLAAALLALAGPARAGEEATPHASFTLAAGPEVRRVSGDTVHASSLGATVRASASMTQTQDDGAVFHTDAFGEIGSIGSAPAGATGVDFGMGVKLPLSGIWGGFFRLGMHAEYASDRAATLALGTFPRLELGALVATKRFHLEATARAALAAGSFTPAIAAPAPPDRPSFATTTHRPLGPFMWGATIRALTPYGHLEATWSRFEPSPRAAGRIDQLEARTCAGYWIVLCAHAGLVRGPVLVPFRGHHQAELVTFGLSLGLGREMDATNGFEKDPPPKHVAE